LQIAHRDQAIVRLDHGEAADIVALGKTADRRQSRAGAQQPVVDLPPEPVTIWSASGRSGLNVRDSMAPCSIAK